MNLIEPDYSQLRQKMVDEQIIGRGITDPMLISSFLKVPRHEFVPVDLRDLSYYDGPLPIGEYQTISQPYIVALMTDLLELSAGDKVLEIGTGSGYQTAILAEYGCEVYSVEIVESLSFHAQDLLKKLGYEKINFKIGDGYEGWIEHSPYDAVIVTASPPKLPQPLVDQLKEGGRMVIPIEEDHQELCIIKKIGGEITTREITPVMFVPMTGEAQKS